ncbi:Adenosine deaminase [Streptococcus suis 98HAH33]|nr:Adenosine deaminase [Streptococcus suis 98HAH33]
MLIMLEVNELVQTELHCHLDGSLSLGINRPLAQMGKITIPAEDEALRKLASVHGKVDSLKA